MRLPAPLRHPRRPRPPLQLLLRREEVRGDHEGDAEIKHHFLNSEIKKSFPSEFRNKIVKIVFFLWLGMYFLQSSHY